MAHRSGSQHAFAGRLQVLRLRGAQLLWQQRQHPQPPRRKPRDARLGQRCVFKLGSLKMVENCGVPASFPCKTTTRAPGAMKWLWCSRKRVSKQDRDKLWGGDRMRSKHRQANGHCPPSAKNNRPWISASSWDSATASQCQNSSNHLCNTMEDILCSKRRAVLQSKLRKCLAKQKPCAICRSYMESKTKHNRGLVPRPQSQMFEDQ